MQSGAQSQRHSGHSQDCVFAESGQGQSQSHSNSVCAHGETRKVLGAEADTGT